MSDLEKSASAKEKETLHLKRALESVYTRFRSREESREAEHEVDAQVMASRAIDNLAKKDHEISTLRAEMEELRVQLAAQPKFITEKEFKSQVQPPPPPQHKRFAAVPGPSTRSELPVSSSLLASPLPAHPPLPSIAPTHPGTLPIPSTFPASSSKRSVAQAMPSSPPPPPPPPPPPVSRENVGRGPAPPPPPTPPSAFRISGPTQPQPIQSKKRLKPVFWNKISTSSLASTVWDEGGLGTALDLTDLESTFAIDSAPSSSSPSAIASPKKQGVTTMLNINRANNVGT